MAYGVDFFVFAIPDSAFRRRHCVFALFRCPVRSFVRPFARTDIVTNIFRERLESTICDKTDREYSLAPADVLIRCWTAKVKG